MIERRPGDIGPRYAELEASVDAETEIGRQAINAPQFGLGRRHSRRGRVSQDADARERRQRGGR
jgi:hypothetical protein